MLTKRAWDTDALIAHLPLSWIRFTFSDDEILLRELFSEISVYMLIKAIGACYVESSSAAATASRVKRQVPAIFVVLQ